MSRTASWMRRRVLMLAIVAIGIAAVSGTALAGHQASGVKSYTGCLTPGDGPITQDQGRQLAEICVHWRRGRGRTSRVVTSRGSPSRTGSSSGRTAATTVMSRSTSSRGSAFRKAVPTAGSPSGTQGRTGGSVRVDNDTTYSASTGLDLSASNQFSIEPAVTAFPASPAPRRASIAKYGFENDGDIQCAAPASAGVRRGRRPEE